MFEKPYRWFMNVTSKPQERGEYSAGYWQAKIRQEAIGLCALYRGRLLEVGCGEGLFLSGLHNVNPGLELWGADEWKKILERGRFLLAEKKIMGVHLVESKGQSLPFDDATFHAVVCVNVFLNIHGLEGVRSILKEMARVCKPGGRIVIEFRNSLNIFVVLKFKLARYYDVTIRERNLPLSTYFRGDIYRLLKEFGFRVVQEHSFGFFLKILDPVIMLEAEKHV